MNDLSNIERFLSADPAARPTYPSFWLTGHCVICGGVEDVHPKKYVGMAGGGLYCAQTDVKLEGFMTTRGGIISHVSLPCHGGGCSERLSAHCVKHNWAPINLDEFNPRIVPSKTGSCMLFTSTIPEGAPPSDVPLEVRILLGRFSLVLRSLILRYVLNWRSDRQFVRSIERRKSMMVWDDAMRLIDEIDGFKKEES